MLSFLGVIQGSTEQGLKQPVLVGPALGTSLSYVTSNIASSLDGSVGWGVRDESLRLWCGRESSGVEVRNKGTRSS